MGYDERRLEVVAAVSRHNSPKDDWHDELWDELQYRIRVAVEDPRYKEIRPWVT
jgi:hypothetical protein